MKILMMIFIYFFESSELFLFSLYNSFPKEKIRKHHNFLNKNQTMRLVSR